MKRIRRPGSLGPLAGPLAVTPPSSFRLAAAENQPALPSADAAPPQRLAWFHEARFGLFRHWGCHALPAGQ